MVDRLTPAQRSRNMAAIRSRGNKSTELLLAGALRRNGIKGWRRHIKILGVRPDFIFSRGKVAIFVHGCFWHGCKVHRKIPTSNQEFWKHKITVNKSRDLRAKRNLRAGGWKVISIWEHDLNKKHLEVTTEIRRATT